jgi:integrase
MAGKLRPLEVERETKPGKYADGDGLYLIVASPTAKNWQFRYEINGKSRWHGLGSFKDVSLKEARLARDAARLRVKVDGVDLVQEKRAARRAVDVKAVLPTFEKCAARYIDEHWSSWSRRHRAEWLSTLKRYAFPIIGKLAIAEIKPSHVFDILEPIWISKRATADRLRGRIETVIAANVDVDGLDFHNAAAMTKQLREKLPKRPKRTARHHPALPYEEISTFWKSLSSDTSDAARMLRWIILTACRYNEARQMNMAEVSGDLWTIPADRMKARKRHEVPLTTAAMAQLPFRSVSDVALAKCIARHTDTSATTHGFRSTFRDWAGDCTHVPREIAELALAHTVGDDTEIAYRRGTALEKRRSLMNDWAEYVTKIVAIRSSAA